MLGASRLAPGLPWPLLLLTLGVMVGAPERAGARCARALFIPTLVTPTDQPLPLSASFLVAMMVQWDRQYEAIAGRFPDDATLVPRVSADSAEDTGEPGAGRIPLRVVVLGAGLARYEPTTTPSAGEYDLVGLGPPRALRFAARGGLQVPLPRPPSRATLDVGPMRVQGTRGEVVTTHAVRATLPVPQAGPPSALIAYWEGEAGAAAVVPTSAREVLLYRSAIPCASPLPGTRSPRAGEGRELAIVDAFGRVSRRLRL